MYRVCDQICVSLARLIRDGETVFHGVSSHLPMVALMLAKRLHAPHATHLNIPGGVDPRPGFFESATSAGDSLYQSAVSAFSLAEAFDLSMRGKLDVSFLSGVQFDRSGGVNASVIGEYAKPKVRLPGGAGSAVFIPTARRAILWRSKHDRRTLVDKVGFLTSRGRVSDLVTPLCHFFMHEGELVLKSVHQHSSIEEVAQHTGFPLRYFTLTQTEPPSPIELATLRKIDPQDLRNLEFLPR